MRLGNVEGRLERPQACYLCLVSVSSEQFSRALVNAYREWADVNGCSLRFVLMDAPERFNILEFEGAGQEAAPDLAAARGRDRSRLMGLSDDEMVTWREAIASVGFEEWLVQAQKLFYGGGSFRRHVLSEVFSNLQPRFRRKGVHRKGAKAVERCAPYLLEEIAFKAAVFSSGAFFGELAPRPETGLMLAIYGGRYLGVGVHQKGFEYVFHDGSFRGSFRWHPGVPASAAKEYFEAFG